MQMLTQPLPSSGPESPRNARWSAERRPHARVLGVSATVARVFLGLTFFVCGLDGFLHFFPVPDASEIPAGAAALGAAMAATGYMLPLIKGTELVVGALMLANRFVPLALTMLAPVTVNIVLFHAVLAPEGLTLALVLVGLQLFLTWTRRDAFAVMLLAR